MAQHCMIDLETLGTGPEALIVSIGAVKFDPADDEAKWDCFHVAIEPSSAQRAGLKIDASTVMWWLAEERASARSAMLDMRLVDVASALEGFAMWYGVDSLPTWGNGAAFD